MNVDSTLRCSSLPFLLLGHHETFPAPALCLHLVPSPQMSSAQGYSTPAPLTEKPGELVGSQQKPRERHQEPPTESLASSSASEVLDRPPQPPSKDRDLEGRLSGDSTPRDSSHSRISHVIDFNTTPQTTLAAAAELITGSVQSRPGVSTSNMTNAGSPANQLVTNRDGTDNNANPNASGSTSNTRDTNSTSTHPNSTTTTIYHHPESQTPSSSRPLSLERRQTGPGLTAYDQIRGDGRIQAYLPDTNGSGEGDPTSLSSRLGSRNTVGRVSVPRPRSAFSPTDGTLVGNGPGSRRASRLMSGQDWLPDVPIVGEPPVSTFLLFSADMS